jgi:hypothetical protein
MTTKYTFARRMTAHYAGRFVVVPDQVEADQHGYDGKTFPALLRVAGGDKKIRVRLDGDAYGLNTPGTGDMVVRAA